MEYFAESIVKYPVCPMVQHVAAWGEIFFFFTGLTHEQQSE